ncbi:MAG: hypothetical protein ABS934_15745 [Psychrobacillus sp.]
MPPTTFGRSCICSFGLPLVELATALLASDIFPLEGGWTADACTLLEFAPVPLN